MATSVLAGEDESNLCPICFEVCSQPKYLPCLHTFCKSCILSYIKSLESTEEKLTFHCPVCRECLYYVYIAFDQHDLEKWVEELPDNQLVVNLIDRNINVHLCDSCLRMNKSEKASEFCPDCSDKLCRTCVEFHKGNRSSMDHKIVPLLEKDGLNKNRDLMALFCDLHPTKKFEVYCFDHDIPCCLMCSINIHRKCDQVSSLEECSKAFQEDVILKLQEQSKKLDNGFSELVYKVQNDHQINETQFCEISFCVKESIEKAINHLKKKGEEFECELASHKKQLNIKYEKEMSEITSRQDRLKKVNTFLWKKNESTVETFLRCKKLEKEIKSVQSFLDQSNEEHESYHLSSEVNKNLDQIAKNITSCCKVRKKSSRKICDFLSDSLTLEKTIDAISSPVDLEIIDENHFVVICQESFMLYLYNINGSRRKELKLPDKPWSMTKVKDYTVAIAIHSSPFYIQIVDICTADPPSLSTNRMIKFYVTPCGIACFDDKFFISNGSKIYQIDNDGALLRKICLGELDMEVYSLCANSNGNIICTCWTSGIVGQVQNNLVEARYLFSDKRLKNPLGVTHDSDGNIYVVGRFSHNVFQLKPCGTLVRQIIGDDPDICNLYTTRVQLMGKKMRLILSSDNKIRIYRFGK